MPLTNTPEFSLGMIAEPRPHSWFPKTIGAAVLAVLLGWGIAANTRDTTWVHWMMPSVAATSSAAPPPPLSGATTGNSETADTTEDKLKDKDPLDMPPSCPVGGCSVVPFRMAVKRAAEVPTNIVQVASGPAELWKQVAKEDATAEVALARLYLEGRGVVQDCAQAQVLLLAASKRNSKITEDVMTDYNERCEASNQH
jgi:hypothetical protein